MWIHDLNTVLDVALFLCFFIVGVFVYKEARRRYLVRSLENSIAGTYQYIPRFDREDIRSLRASLNQAEGLVNQEYIDRARILLDAREKMLELREKIK